MPEPPRERTGSAHSCPSAPRGIQLTRRPGELVNVPFRPQPCTGPEPFKSPLSGSGTRAVPVPACSSTDTAANRDPQGSGKKHACANPGAAYSSASPGTALRTRLSPHRSTHAPLTHPSPTPIPHARASKKQSACTALGTARRMRHDRYSTTHARAPAPHCACSSLGTALRMCKSRDRAAHVPAFTRHCACASLGAALRTRQCTPVLSHAHFPVYMYACVVSDSSLRRRRAQGPPGARFACSRGWLEFQPYEETDKEHGRLQEGKPLLSQRCRN